MKKTFIIFVCFIYILSIYGCTTIQPLGKDISYKRLKNLIKTGDRVVIHTQPFGKKHYGIVNTILVEKIIIEDPDKVESVFYLKDIESIEKEDFSPGKTLVVIALLPVIAEVAASIFVLWVIFDR